MRFQLVKRALQRVSPVVVGSAVATWDFYHRNKAASELWGQYVHQKYHSPNYPVDSKLHEDIVQVTLQTALRPTLLPYTELLVSNVDHTYGVNQYIEQDPNGFGLVVKTIITYPSMDAQSRTAHAWERDGFSDASGLSATELRANFDAFALSHELTHANEYHQMFKVGMLSIYAGVKSLVASSIVSTGIQKLGARSMLMTLPLLGILRYLDFAIVHRLDIDKPQSQRVPRSIRSLSIGVQRVFEQRADQGAIEKVKAHASPEQAKRILQSTLFVMRKLQQDETQDELNGLGHPAMSDRADKVEASLK